ncbi:MAG TPA: hypothetical protein VL598_04635 [Trinickia sp.]|jgi:hypothetical protein|uniref:hypothetical protein n=1 Tax=Trinickia sp. TaxID=2571163 RepID=UPI002D0AAEB5|nr:hypothetical protein [Trinickia sp.]HTI16928.1 hypothetical protein [Trinickia sp.]
MNVSKLATAGIRCSLYHGTAAAVVGALIGAASLTGCAVGPPPGSVLSRLAPDQPGAASSARPLTQAEKQRYDEIDEQVMREQRASMDASAWVRYYNGPYYASPVIYGSYGSYYNGWGIGYSSPGYYGWWW